MMLADMGADVLKVDTPAQETSSASRRNQVASHTNRNKRSIALNLKSPDGLALFLQLVRDADVLVEGFRPGVMQRLGVGYDVARTENPRLVYCSLSGFGQTGPYRLRPAHDLNFLALSGALSLWGSNATVPPDIPLNLVADYGGAAMHGALAIMMALFARERGAPGQHLDISYLETTVSLLAATPNLRAWFETGRMAPPGSGVFCGGYPYYGLYATRDRRWLSVACSEPHLWRNFCEAIGKPQHGIHARQPVHYTRAPNAEEHAAREDIARHMATHDCEHWVQLLAQADVCVAPVNDVAQMLADPHLRERRLVANAHHLEFGDIAQFASPLRLSETPPLPSRPAPTVGENTEAVLNELGLNAARIRQLRSEGVVG